MAISATAGGASRSMTREEKKVIFASSLGTVFEWYDFYLYGSLAAFIGATFFSSYPEATRNIFALLAFAAGLPGASVRRAGVRPHRRPRRPQIHLPRHHPDHGHLDLPGRPAARLRHLGHRGSGDPHRSAHAAGPRRSAASMAAPPPTWPNTRRMTVAATTRPGSRPPPHSAFSCRWW